MAGFKATEKVGGLEYDFSGLTVADQDDQALLDAAKGITPEPPTVVVRHFNAEQNALLDLPADASPQDRLRKLATMTEEELGEIDETQLDIFSELTSGQPSREEMAALPFRHRQAYYGWMLGELVNPSAGTASTRRSVVPLRSATS